MTTVGQMIRDRARELGQADEAVARILDVSSSTVTRWRQDKIAPRRDKVPALASWLGVNEADVLAALGDKPGPSLADVAAVLQSAMELLARLDQRVSVLERGPVQRGSSGRRSARLPTQ